MPSLWSSHAGIVIVDRSGAILYSNKEADRILSYQQITGERSASSKRTLLRVSPQNGNGTERLMSGRRHYILRRFELTSQDGSQQRLAILLERPNLEGHSILTDSAARYRLTSREGQVVDLLVAGLSTKEIAIRLSLSPSTIKTFLRTLMMKTGASNRIGVVSKLLTARDNEVLT